MRHSTVFWASWRARGCNYLCHLNGRWYKPANAYINHFYYKELVEVLGCTSATACNFNPDATQDDGSCDTISCVQDNSPANVVPQVSSGEFWGGLSAAMVLLVIIAGVAFFMVLRNKSKRRLELTADEEDRPMDESSLGLVLCNPGSNSKVIILWLCS